ncbi:MAG: gephyrin-like molybdotransferase Glp [Planctomycetota bacterium]
MVSIGEAQQKILRKIPTRRRVARRAIEEAIGQALAEDVIARTDLPPFDRITMDGFAVRSADVAKPPVKLTVKGEVAAGDTGDGATLEPGTAVRVMTGAPLPSGADAVVREEDTLGEGPQVEIRVAVKPNDNTAPRGQDIKRGAVAFKRGEVLSVSSIGLLAALGHREIPVFERPEVAILTTGNELLEPGAVLTPGKICDSNRFALAAQVLAAGGTPRLLGIARDDEEELRDKVEQGLLSEILLITGGSSVGKYDYAQRVVERLGGQVHFAGVSIKPGKPLIFATHGSHLIFCLPGNPVSAFVTFELFVKPAVVSLAGIPDPMPAIISARLTRAVKSPRERDLVLVATLSTVEGQVAVTPIDWHGSGDQVALARAEALILLEAAQERNDGDLVRVLPLSGARAGALAVPRAVR